MIKRAGIPFYLLIIQLPDPTVVIRKDNEYSFQGPVPELTKVLSGVSQ